MSAFQSTAYLLVSHGSRDSRPQAAMDRLAHLVREELLERRHQSSPPVNTPQGKQKSIFLKPSKLPLRQDVQSTPQTLNSKGSLMPLVGTACLEFGFLPLSQQISAFCQRVEAAGVKRVRIVPIFLLKGIHVMEDIPTEVEQARLQKSTQITIEVCPHLGNHPLLRQVLQKRVHEAAVDALLVLAHGSRRPGGNYAVERLARELQAEMAFWAVPPSLEHQVVQMIQLGHQRLAILPYFLFPGGITDAITRLTEDLAERFPKVNMRLLPPLGATREIASLITDLAVHGTAYGSLAALPMPLMALRY